MITVVNFPPENRVLLDGNNTPITVTSTNGFGFYFRASIFIDDQLFDEQGWSRKDNFTATKDLMYLFNAYFKPFFIADFETGLFLQQNFKKKVKIVISERLILDDSEVVSITLPEFFIMYNVKSTVFNDTNKIQLFGLNAERYRMKRNGIIVIPFYANAENETVSVTVYDDLDNILHTQEVQNLSGKNVFVYNLKLSEITVLSTSLFLKVVINVGIFSLKKIYNLINLPNYDVQEIVYQNNFGFYIPAYFDGDFEDASNLKPQSYERYDKSNSVYAVDEDGVYTINTGSLTILEKEVIKEIGNSIDCYYNKSGKYLQVNTALKKATNLKSRQNIYSEDLQFTFKVGLSFMNLNVNGSVSAEGEETPVLTLLNLTFLGEVDNSGIAMWNFIAEYSANIPLFQVFYQIRANITESWTPPVEVSVANSNFEYGLFIGETHQLRMFTYHNGIIVYSNILTHTA